MIAFIFIINACSEEKDDTDEEVKHAADSFFIIDCQRVNACDLSLLHKAMDEYREFAPEDVEIYLIENYHPRMLEHPPDWPDDVIKLSWQWRERSSRNTGFFHFSEQSAQDLVKFVNDTAIIEHSAMVFHLSGTKDYAVLERKLWGNFLAALSKSSSYGIYELHQWERWAGDLEEEYENFVEEICVMFHNHPDADNINNLTPCHRLRYAYS